EVTVDPSVGYAMGQGSTLRVTGVAVTVDATALSYTTVSVLGTATTSPAQPRVLRLLPGGHKFGALYAPGWVDFAVGPTGEVTVDPSVGYAMGQGSTLRVTGVAVTVDATALSYTTVSVLGTATTSPAQPRVLRLLPGGHKFGALYAPGWVDFAVGPTGEVTVDPSVG